jgi:hypothetical protein
MSNNNTNSGGIGIFGLLGVLFVGLKLTGHIDWSWWWVTFPFWGGFALVVMIIFITALMSYFVER